MAKLMAGQKEEVVISGVGGLFPECDNVDEFKHLLFDKLSGVTINSKRWIPNELGASSATGKLKNIDRFDSTFFSAHPKLTENMDPITRKFLETSINAIIDAGMSPSDLNGTNTAVFSGSAISETEMFTMDSSRNAAFSMLGRSKTMQANRVSYILNLIGPSFTSDGGWICGSNGLEKAKNMIENGVITSAIVGCTNMVLKPEIQFQFQGLNRLTKTDQTKPFTEEADGYNRSEACIVMFLQRASDAKRSYGTLLSVKSLQYGDHQEYITEHTGEHYKSLLLDSYKEANIDPSTVEFIEAYGSGIKNEDAMEINVLEEVFCTKDRKTPLKIGSVKSNVGHCEVAGLFVSIVKAIIALDSGHIPPNLNYSNPNEKAKALITGKIQVITESTRFTGDVIGVSSFGILNAFSHVILKRNNKVKTLCSDTNDSDFIPRLILASGRNEENARETIKMIKSHGNDAEYVALTNEVFTKNINAHFYRSFSIFPNLDETRVDEVMNVDMKKRPVWFIFSGMGSQWQGMGSNLMKIPVFADAIMRCDSILKPRGVDIVNILTNQDPKLFDNILNSFVGIAAVQIGLVEVLNALNITPDGIVGHSVGELGCAYADGCFTAEEMILSAYARGRASLETDLIPGMMAAIGLGYDDIKDKLPQDIDVACRNSATSCTISGPVESINVFVTELKSQGIFAKAVNVAGIAYHSRYIQSAGPTLLKYLKEVIKEPKMRSSKWISSSVPETNWNSDLAKYSSPEYHTNNLLSSVLFEDVLKHIPSDAIAIEIAPHGLLQAIIRGALPATVTNIPLTKRMYGDSVRFLLTAIGKMYASGINPTIQALYPTVSFPVSRGTPSIQSLPIWDHNQMWTPIVTLTSQILGIPGERSISLLLNDSIHLTKYRIHDRHFMPISYVLFDVWKMFIEMEAKTLSEEPVQFQNLRFKNNVIIHPTNPSECYLMIQWGSGQFEYNLNDEVIFSGKIGFLTDENSIMNPEKSTDLSKTSDDYQGSVSKEEIYNLMENHGYDLGDNFKNITNINFYKQDIQGYVEWNNDWIYFMDSLLKIPSMDYLDVRRPEAPISVRQISINPAKFEKNTKRNVCVNYNTVTREITCDGLKISDVKNGSLSVSKHGVDKMKLEEQKFVNFTGSNHCKNITDFVNDAIDVIMESDKLNLNTTAKKFVLCTPYHYDDPTTKACTKYIKQVLENQRSINNITMSWENVKKISEKDESGRFITVTNFDYMQETIKSLANKKCCYIFVCSKRKLLDLKDWKIITQQMLNDNNCLALIKKEIIVEKNSIFLNSKNAIYDLKIWAALHKCKSSIIYIISFTEPLEGVTTYVKEMLLMYKSQNLRFLFILDSNAPTFESNKTFYTNQLSKGLIVNIYKNGGWGSYKKIGFQELKDCTKVTEIPILKNLSSNNKKILTVKYLGFNFNDLVVEDNTKNEFGPLEYSGIFENSKRIIGITSFNKNSSQIQYDEYLSWPAPSKWSLDEATTVPLAYAMSYYVFNVLCTSLQEEKSILVTSGLHPIGLAAIAIGLAKKWDTYAIVESTKQMDRLSDLYPELPRSRIFVNSNDKFDVQLQMLTKSKGVDIILNFLSGEAFQAAFRTLAYHGEFFHFAKSDMKNYGNIGTRIFLKNTSFTAISSNMLLNESECNKQTIHKAFMDGLNKGVVRPFQRCTVRMPFNNSEVFDAMRTAALSFEKVILSVDDELDKSKSQKQAECVVHKCHPDRIYVIVGNKSDWLDVAEWLVDRGAQKIVIAAKRCLMSSIICRRFDRLISRNVSVQIESDSYLKTRKESLNWLNRLTSSNGLGSIYVVNQCDIIKINNIRFAFEDQPNKTITTSFVCISSKGENNCAELKSLGFNALNISWDGKSSKQNHTSNLLLSLDTLLQKSSTTESSSFVCSEQDSQKSTWSQQINDLIVNFFPESAEELHLLNEKLTKEADFVEIPTKSPRLSQLKSVLPIFVIPGFKPKLIKSLYKNMLYPVFEAQLPEDVSSIDELSNKLVEKLKRISDRDYVSLIGESWGGVVALKMAQILEAQGTLVSVALLEGDPGNLTEWAEYYLTKVNISHKLNTIYSSYSNEFSKYALQNSEKELHLLNNMTSYQKTFEKNTQKALNWIRSSLQAILESKPLSNKLKTNVLIFKYQQTFEFSRINIFDYCVNPPLVHRISETDYKHMMVNRKMIEIISKNVVHTYPTGVDISLSEKYKNFFYFAQKYLKNL